MTEVHGHVDNRFSAVSDALAKNLADGVEVGASLVVDIGGETVVDIWGGHRDAARTRPWTEDTIVTVWSSTKTVTSLAALMLVDRGLLDPYERVARYWPEFAANGKDAVEVRHLLSHTSGVSAWEQPFAAEDSFDLAASTAKLAAQPAWWEPGTASGYHASNFGHLVGELVRRVSGRSLTDFVAEEIAGPAGADFQLGARPADHGRIATMLSPEAAPPAELPPPDPGSVFTKTLMGSFQDPAIANTPEWLAAENGACNGHGNARSVARIVSALALGGVTGGVRLLHPETIELIFDEQAHGPDLFLGIPLRWGIGYALPEPEGTPFVPAGRVCFWGGWGGSLIIVDVERRMTISYMMNQMQPGIIGSPVSAAYCDVITACAAGA
ncbi:EstA family serine hydrolase [Cryptosporangium arvum]|uniref:Penicillin-binding protein, beta-lactamase class C n=1 Tax=Cryptosporangium arvum DSM 44712 TaxID=927661 RepID=A0A010YR49_9ACTN|nr:EstA family serine hydrolase [Cryptosporangium arvum]EXG82670.1 penicillin-binding protein, beta-lactamase class C [Cryptosporangium arvum DSM 44712]